MTYSPRFHSPNLKGPVPTGLSQLPSAFTELLCRMAVMPQSVRASVSRNTAEGLLIFITKVLSSGVAVSTTFRPLRPSYSLVQRQSVFGSM